MSIAAFIALESRVLCSTTPHAGSEPKPVIPTVPSDPAVLAADQATISAALAKLQSDFASNAAALTAARQARVTDAAAIDLQLKAQRTTLANDDAAVKALGPAAEARTKAIYAKWAPIIGPEEKDVKTNTEGETDEERAADAAKLASDRAAAMAELTASQAQAKSVRATADAKSKSDHAAYDVARKYADAKLKTDSVAISAVENLLKTAFQSDRTILLADLAQYRKDGGNVDALHLPALPKM